MGMWTKLKQKARPNAAAKPSLPGPRKKTLASLPGSGRSPAQPSPTADLKTGRDFAEPPRQTPSFPTDEATVVGDVPDLALDSGISSLDSATTPVDASQIDGTEFPRQPDKPAVVEAPEEKKDKESEEKTEEPEQLDKPTPQPASQGLWAIAADSLEHPDKKRLARLLQIRRHHHSDANVVAPNVMTEIDRVISTAQNLEQENKTAVWRPVVGKIVRGALTFKKLGDKVAELDQSGYAAIGWSVVSAGLQMVVNADETRQFALSSADFVAGLLLRYAEYETQFRGAYASSEFDQRITNVYKAVLLYVLDLDDYFNQCKTQHAVRALYQLDDRSIAQKKKELDEADALVKDWLLIIIFKSNKDYFTMLLKRLDADLPVISKKTEDCTRSLAFREMDDRFKDIDTAAEGTCSWLLHHQEYQKWMASDHGLLWIKGKPGSGKSTLLQYALRDALISSDLGEKALVLSFFFHGRGVDLQKTPLGLYRSLLYQLLEHAPETLQDLVDTFTIRRQKQGIPGKDWHWHQRDLEDVFKSSLRQVLETRSVWLFVDALDESGKENATKLVTGFKSLLKGLPSTGFQFHLCFSCRHYPILSLNYGFEICVEDENAEDICTYVHAQLADSKVPPDLIIERANGVFLWCRLVIEKALDLELTEEVKAIEEEIKTTPPDLENLYAGLVNGIEKKADSLKLLQWVCFSMRPLTLDELRWALVIDAKCHHRSFKHCRADKSYTDDNDLMERKLKRMTCGLVETTATYTGCVVQFIHQSVNDFFVNERGLETVSNNISPSNGESNFVGQAHYRISRSCIRYLAMDELRTPETLGEFSEYPLLDYSAEYWALHSKRSEDEGVPQEDLLGYFSWPSENLVQVWAKLYSGLESNAQRTTMLHVLSRFGLVGPLRAIIQRTPKINVNFNAIDGTGRSPLSLAAELGHSVIVQLLLRTNQADVNSQNKDGITPMIMAACNGHSGPVQLLVDTGKAILSEKDEVLGRKTLIQAATKGHASIVRLLLGTGQINCNFGNKFKSTPLMLAARYGHEAVVRILIEAKDVEIDGVDFFGWTPLAWAAQNGFDTIVRLLIETNQVDVDAVDRYGRAPLSWAARNGHEDVVRHLLNTGKVNVDSKDNEGLTPLSLAAKGGYEEIVRMLLDTGRVDISARDRHGRTALTWAAGDCHEAVARLLLERGIGDIDLADKDFHQTPLSYAAEKGSVGIVRLLLETRTVDVDSKDRHHQTPLDKATSAGHGDVVELLLKHTGKPSQDYYRRYGTFGDE